MKMVAFIYSLRPTFASAFFRLKQFQMVCTRVRAAVIALVLHQTGYAESTSDSMDEVDLQAYGVTDVADELDVVAGRLSKLVALNLKTFRGLYETIISTHVSPPHSQQ